MRSLYGAWAVDVVAKTANYTVLEKDCGKLFTNRGASGTITFTLPKTQTRNNGWWAEFATVAAQAIVIATNPADNLIVHADATADSVTTAATIGQHFRIICDGTGYFMVSSPSVASAATAVTAVTLAS